MRDFLQHIESRIWASFLYVGTGFLLVYVNRYIYESRIQSFRYSGGGVDLVLPIMKEPIFWGVMAGLFALAMIFQFCLYRVLLENNKGWMRLTLVLGGVGAIAGAVYTPLFDEYLELWDVIFGLYAFAPLGALIMVIPILLGRWVKEGFSAGKGA